jgi:hypothetical protein
VNKWSANGVPEKRPHPRQAVNDAACLMSRSCDSVHFWLTIATAATKVSVCGVLIASQRMLRRLFAQRHATGNNGIRRTTAHYSSQRRTTDTDTPCAADRQSRSGDSVVFQKTRRKNMLPNVPSPIRTASPPKTKDALLQACNPTPPDTPQHPTPNTRQHSVRCLATVKTEVFQGRHAEWRLLPISPENLQDKKHNRHRNGPTHEFTINAGAARNRQIGRVEASRVPRKVSTRRRAQARRLCYVKRD